MCGNRNDSRLYVDFAYGIYSRKTFATLLMCSDEIIITNIPEALSAFTICHQPTPCRKLCRGKSSFFLPETCPGVHDSTALPAQVWALPDPAIVRLRLDEAPAAAHRTSFPLGSNQKASNINRMDPDVSQLFDWIVVGEDGHDRYRARGSSGYTCLAPTDHIQHVKRKWIQND
ncbi:hypothetical protein EYF80_029374 [Liparis tanakae]|uniref:Uncharacterized protein n=1 Tax=Liparis tanakae TaxID=230148 RepID=A0A4Z2H525_9TELE|nr:hypothetical protein EYF80_029374 [Liparis tanakae]